MVEKFRESDKAANYVTTGLMHDFPEATVEVIQVLKNRSRRRPAGDLVRPGLETEAAGPA